VRGQQVAKSRRHLRLRIWIVLGVFAATFLVLLGRSVDLQVLRQDRLESLAQKEFMRQAEVAPRRGIIFDRNQEELAVSLDTHSVYAQPVMINKDEKKTGRALAKALGRKDPGKIIRKLKSERRFVWIARRIDPDQALKVQRLKLPGVGLVKEPKRFYPYSRLASHVLGFAGMDAKGLEGLEAHFNQVLRGKPRKVRSMRDARGGTVHLTKAAFTRLPEGNHLILTLDKNLQYQAEKLLTATVSKYKAKSGQVLVMVPRTGEILAMASLPDFNPNVYSRFPGNHFRNRTITDFFEPGSTFKVFVGAAALDSGRISTKRLFNCEGGKWKVGGRTIHDTKPHHWMTLSQIIKVSSNIGTAKVGMTLGAKTLYDYFRAFGFGRISGVDLPGEVAGLMRPQNRLRPVELANICFGQGLAVTPLQLLTAVSAIANDGVLMRPFMVKAELDQKLRLVRETKPRISGRAMKAKDARRLARMMTLVTQEGGTGTRAAIEGIKVAGKTGTAQKPTPSGYSHTDYIASFVGFAPADDPKVAVLVVIDTPKGNHYGGVVAGPVFKELTSYALKLMGDYPTASPKDMAKAELKNGDEVEMPAAPRSLGMEPLKAMASGLAPDMRGLTLRQVLRFSAQVSLQVQAKGWGRVVSQSPQPGQPMSSGLVLTLKPAGGEV
jgi:cell division protein FtsI (penicillin-binding protein 3)